MYHSGSGSGNTPDSIDDKLSGITPNVAYVSKEISVGSTQTEARVGASPLANRRLLIFKNYGPDTIYYGPSGVTTSGANTGIDLANGGVQSLAIGPALPMFLICASGSSANVVIQELS